MLEKLVEAALRYKFLVLIIFGVVAFLGWRAVVTVPVDAFPDVTPTQVNIYTESPGLAAEDVEQFEKAILTDRNVAWVDLLVGLEEQNIVAAFGAGHLPGELGVLYLLEQQGFEITQLPVEP